MCCEVEDAVAEAGLFCQAPSHFRGGAGSGQDEAGFMRKFETTHVGGAKC